MSGRSRPLGHCCHDGHPSVESIVHRSRLILVLRVASGRGTRGSLTSDCLFPPWLKRPAPIATAPGFCFSKITKYRHDSFSFLQFSFQLVAQVYFSVQSKECRQWEHARYPDYCSQVQVRTNYLRPFWLHFLLQIVSTSLL